MKKKDSKEELQRYLDLCDGDKKLNKKVFKSNKFDYRILNRCAKEEGYTDFNDFLKIHNIKNESIKITNEELLTEAKRVYDINNNLTTDLLHKSKYGYSIYKRRFGSLNKIAELLELKDYKPPREIYKKKGNNVVDNTIFKYEIGEIVDTKYSKVQVIDLFTKKKKTQSGRAKYIKFKCLECGNEGEVYESSFVKGHVCKECSKRKIKEKHLQDMYLEVKNFIENLGYELISNKFEGVHKSLKVKCDKGHMFERSYSTFKGSKNRDGVCSCPICNGITINTYDSVKSDLESHNIKLLSNEYKNNTSKLKIEYQCGHEFDRGYYYIKNSNYKCPKCNRKGYGRDTEQLRKEIEEITSGEYELLSEYKNSTTKIKIKHNKCGTIYKTTSHLFLDNNCRCPKCSMSKGENMFKELLMRNNIKFEEQYTFNDCRYKNPLPFDFYISELNLCIEYQGEQHYKPMEYFGGKEGFKLQEIRDNIKRDYCKKNNIILIEIPYWDFDILEDYIDEIKEISQQFNK